MPAATSIAIAGLAVSAGSTGLSFAQAGKQRKLQRQAERDAEQAMAEARKKLEVNFYDQLSIQKEPYELEREAMLSTGGQLIEAGVESERGAAATAGRVYMGQQEGQRQIASAMGQELTGLEKLSAQEESRLRDMGVQVDLGEVQGAQLAARDAQEAAAAATTAGVQGIQSLGQQAISMAPLYGKTSGARKFENILSEASKQGISQSDLQQRMTELAKVDPRFSNLSGVGYTATGLDAQGKAVQGLMTPLAAKDYISGLGKDYNKLLFEALFPKK